MQHSHVGYTGATHVASFVGTLLLGTIVLLGWLVAQTPQLLAVAP